VVLHRPTPLPPLPQRVGGNKCNILPIGVVVYSSLLQEGLWTREPRRVVSISPRR
jgi:hypothetical protein